MIKSKNILYIFGIIVISISVSCKKTTYYGISDFVKEYFSYKQGSYWIYKNDSTGEIDSTFVSAFNYLNNFTPEDYPDIKLEQIVMIFQSPFLSESKIWYLSCSGPNYVEYGSKLDTINPPDRILRCRFI